MTIFAVTSEYSDDVATRDALRSEHRDHLRRIAGQGLLLASGPFGPTEPAGALLLFRAADKTHVERSSTWIPSPAAESSPPPPPDHNRAASQIARHLAVPADAVRKVTIWGNRSSSSPASPVISRNGRYDIVQGLRLDQRGRDGIDRSVAELLDYTGDADA
jgi:uncharacterized protein YciI